MYVVSVCNILSTAKMLPDLQTVLYMHKTGDVNCSVILKGDTENVHCDNCRRGNAIIAIAVEHLLQQQDTLMNSMKIVVNSFVF